MKHVQKIFLSFSAALLLAACDAPRHTTKNTAAQMNTNPAAEVTGQLKHYPTAKAGYKQMVIYLPEKTREEEGGYKVEILPGKTAKVDCNSHSLTGTLTRKEVKGFGYDYYEFQSDGNMAATRMACPDGKMTEKFVYGKTELLDYNSRLPIVVYVPDGFGLKYRVWTASAMGDAKS